MTTLLYPEKADSFRVRLYLFLSNLFFKIGQRKIGFMFYRKSFRQMSLNLEKRKKGG